tara:strand:+ start:433 stop:687 length:255 start_codon:yes stop_codon:yes gene_type:complete
MKETNLYELKEVSGKTKFNGCQCFNDCSCSENFVSSYYQNYIVKRKTGKYKRTVYFSINSALDRCKELDNLAANGKLGLNPITD